MKADPRLLAGRAVGAGEKHQRAGREALAVDPGVETVARDHVGHALAFAQPPAGRMEQERADARRLADRLVDRGRSAVVDAAGERNDAAIVAQRHLEGFGRLLALGDRPVLLEERTHPAELADRRDGGDARARAGRAATRRSTSRRRGRRSADMVGAEHRPEPHRDHQRLEAQHRDGDRAHRAAVAELAEHPGAERRQAPGEQDRVQPERAAQRILADQMAPEKSGASLPARGPARQLPSRRHIRSISELVIDQWVVTSP